MTIRYLAYGMVISETYLIVLSTAIAVATVVTLFACICGCRRKIPPNDLLGLAGIVKLGNASEYSSPPVVLLQECKSDNEIFTAVTTSQSANSLKRMGTALNSNFRSLPELPAATEVTTQCVTGISPPPVINTVAGAVLPITTAKEEKEEEELVKAAVQQNEYAAESCSTSLVVAAVDTCSELYATVDNDRDEGDGSSGYARLQNAARPHIDETVSRSVVGVFADDTTAEIPAASAISGVIAAGIEIPYMTPPVHFNGNSRDSSRGYTSISVREPISQISVNVDAAQIEVNTVHYTAISEDCDDTYAAIADSASNGNDSFYAQIQPQVDQQNSYSSAEDHVPSSSVSGQQTSNERVMDVMSDMYAKVTKKKKRPLPTNESNDDDASTFCSPHYETIKKQSTNVGIVRNDGSVFGALEDDIEDTNFGVNGGYETIPAERNAVGRQNGCIASSAATGYETVPARNGSSSNSSCSAYYERIVEPNYEEIRNDKGDKCVVEEHYDVTDYKEAQEPEYASLPCTVAVDIRKKCSSEK